MTLSTPENKIDGEAISEWIKSNNFDDHGWNPSIPLWNVEFVPNATNQAYEFDSGWLSFLSGNDRIESESNIVCLYNYDILPNNLQIWEAHNTDQDSSTDKVVMYKEISDAGFFIYIDNEIGEKPIDSLLSWIAPDKQYHEDVRIEVNYRRNENGDVDPSTVTTNVVIDSNNDGRFDDGDTSYEPDFSNEYYVSIERVNEILAKFEK